jgi:methyl farnesoate epoxidase / farnesoate epoxidase
VVGNIFLMRGRPLHLITRDLSEKYGEITGFFLGSCPVILVAGLAAVKEAAAKDELNGRPVSKLQLEIGNGLIRGKNQRAKSLWIFRHIIWGFRDDLLKSLHFSGLIFSQGDLWQEQRRFTLRHLRDLGFGKRSLEGLIHEEINSLIVNVSRMAGPDWAEPVELYDILGTSGLNVLWHVMAGKEIIRLEI